MPLRSCRTVWITRLPRRNRAELTPLLEELQTQLLCLRRLGDQASDAGHGGIAAWHL